MGAAPTALASLSPEGRAYLSKPSVQPGVELDFLQGMASTLSSQLPSFLQQTFFTHYPVPEALERADYGKTVNVAITGASGVGKSLFVNNVRGVKHGDPTWAPVGVSETTADARWYTFPGEPRVRLWDMEGASCTCTSENVSELYIRKVGLRYFDVVLVLSARRFTEVEYTLVMELHQNSVPFFFVRTKLDVDIMNNQADNMQTPEDTAQKIRQDLHEAGIHDPYLVNVREVRQYDFPRLFADVLVALANPLHEVVTQYEMSDD